MKCYQFGETSKSRQPRCSCRFTPKVSFFCGFFFSLIFQCSYIATTRLDNLQDYYQDIISSSDLKTLRDFLYFAECPLESSSDISAYEESFLSGLITDETLRQQLLDYKHRKADELHLFVISEELKPETYNISFRNDKPDFVSNESSLIVLEYQVQAVNADGIVLSTQEKKAELTLQRNFADLTPEQRDPNPTGLKILSYKVSE